jgi:hypothetical protein
MAHHGCHRPDVHHRHRLLRIDPQGEIISLNK